MANRRNGTLYVGVTSDLLQRVSQHRLATGECFAASHGCKLLVFHELHADMTAAITREKQLKAGSRARKLALIECLPTQPGATCMTAFFDRLPSLRMAKRRGNPKVASAVLSIPGLPRRRSASQ